MLDEGVFTLEGLKRLKRPLLLERWLKKNINFTKITVDTKMHSESHRAWQRATALSYRERKAEEARKDGVAMWDDALDKLAAAYVGATAEQVRGWRMGRP